MAIPKKHSGVFQAQNSMVIIMLFSKGETIMKKIILIIFLLITSFIFDFPPLQAYQQGSVNIMVPLSWAVQVDENQGAIYLQEDPNNPEGAEVFFITSANSNNTNLQILINQAIQNMRNIRMTNI